MSVSVTIPSSVNAVKVTTSARTLHNNTAGRYTQPVLWDGTVGSGISIGGSSMQAVSGAQEVPYCSAVIYPVTPGSSHTFNLSLNISGGASTGRFSAISTQPAFMIVEASYISP